MLSQQEIIEKVKCIIYRFDSNAEIILFGSRARGDEHEESDYDFLILSELPESEKLKQQVRAEILEEIEFKTFEVIHTIWHNKKVWEDDYAISGIYESIQEDGIKV